MQLITNEYRKLNENLHNTNQNYGTSGHLYSDEVLSLCKRINSFDVLDYGCGKNSLANTLPFSIKKYDPAIRAFHEDPEPADLVVCTDVMEHIEPELLEQVLLHIKSKCKKLVYFALSTSAAAKTLADGRNAHINLKTCVEWFNVISEHFVVLDYKKSGELVVMIVAPEEKLVKLPEKQPIESIESAVVTAGVN